MLSGSLECRRCGRQYPVAQGIAQILPHGGMGSPSRYEEEAVLSSYLWSQYGDVSGEESPNEAYQTWAGLLRPMNGWGLDIGCAAGRMTFEMARHCKLAIGLDSSLPFVALCRKLAGAGGIEYSLAMEGKITEERHIALPPALRRSNVEFLVASALALPFPRSTFSLAGSLNILDKISHPLLHLQETSRICTDIRADLVFSDPFSWSAKIASEEEWLGGMHSGRFSGWGEDNVRDLLQGEYGLIRPSWRMRKQGEAFWTIRNHRNHFEHIRSRFLVAER